jgi:hypothetical protein
MLQTHSQSTSMPRKWDALVSAMDRLRQALAADLSGQQWVEKLRVALFLVDNALRQHMKSAEVPDGLFAAVDETRPTLGRQVNDLSCEYSELLGQVFTLQLELRSAASGCVTSPKLAALRQQAEQLLTALQKVEEAETDLIQESVTTDIGVGD